MHHWQLHRWHSFPKTEPKPYKLLGFLEDHTNFECFRKTWGDMMFHAKSNFFYGFLHPHLKLNVIIETRVTTFSRKLFWHLLNITFNSSTFKIKFKSTDKKFLRTFARFLWRRMQSRFGCSINISIDQKKLRFFSFLVHHEIKSSFLAFVCNTKNVSMPLFEHKKLQ